MHVRGYGRLRGIVLTDEYLFELAFDSGRKFTMTPEERVVVV